ncbi:DUF4232 domain-containing protein [Streptomyces sp. NPDC002446]
MLRIRIHIRPRAVTAAAVALAALSLTACGASSSDARTPGNATDAATPSPGGNADATGNGNGNGKGNGSSNGNGNGNGSSNGNGSGPGAGPGDGKSRPSPSKGSSGGKAPGQGSGSSDACTGDNVTATITKVPRPLNHLLLTVTNKGSRPCNAFFAPSLRFDDDQAATQVNEASKPQAVVSVAPGRSAYASVLLSGESGGDTHGRTARKLTVYLTPSSGSGSAGAPLTLSLPAGTYKDDNASVSYWQTSPSDALQF